MKTFALILALGFAGWVVYNLIRRRNKKSKTKDVILSGGGGGGSVDDENGRGRKNREYDHLKEVEPN